MRLGVIAAIALAVMYFLQNHQNLVKNEGMLTEEAMAEEAIPALQVEEATEEAPVKVTKHAQVDGISEDEEHTHNVKNDQLYKNNTNVLPMPQMSNNNSPQGNFEPSRLQNFSHMDCFPKDQLNAKDLVPREDSFNAWNQSNPPVQGHLSNKNYLDSGHNFGLNSVGQSLKNPNLQLRSDPLIPQKDVGPWMQSTIEADTNRRPFEISGF